MSTRSDFTEGLRQIADFLDAHPEVPLPYLGSYAAGGFQPTLFIYLTNSEDQKADLAAIARAMGKAEKVIADDRFRVFRRFGGIALVAQADRDEVCERVVTGTEVVTKTVPDPSVEVPMVEVQETVEVVEWRCSPLLSGGTR